MKEKDHYVQDAIEVYAVARLQELAESLGLAKTQDSSIKYEDFFAYCGERGITEADFASGGAAIYKDNLETHLPSYVSGLAALFPADQMDFINVEKEFRNLNRKGDFLIRFTNSGDLPVSIKNYLKKEPRPQVCAGTFNSFAINFVFEPNGVGTFVNPVTGENFRSSDTAARDKALTDIGRKDWLEHLHAIDLINASMRKEFIESPEWEFLDEPAFDKARKSVGAKGAKTILSLVQTIDHDTIKRRLLGMIGFDGESDLIFVYPGGYTDSLTNPKFRALQRTIRDVGSKAAVSLHGQGLRFVFRDANKDVLTVDIPCTINKNGAWISEATPPEGTYHKKEGMVIKHGQRRPKKSREIATSINTYVNLRAAGIFSDLDNDSGSDDK